MSNKWLQSLILACLFYTLFGALTLQASDYPDGVAVNPLTPKDIPEERRMVKLFSVNRSDLFTGEYLYEIPINVPPAKGGMVPNVALKYNSGVEYTSIGFGWDLEYSYIHRSLKYGIPKYSRLTDGSSSQDKVEYNVGGSSGELVFIQSTPYGYLYRPKIDGSFLKFYYKPSTEEWKVYDLRGNIWIFGNNTLPGAAALDVDPNDFSRIFAWYVRRIADPDGNTIEYLYNYTTVYGLLQLGEINYDLNAYGTNIQPKIVFEYDYTGNLIGSAPSGQSDVYDWPHVSYQKGYRTRYGEEGLKRITVYGWDEKSPSNYSTREYTLGYRPIKRYAGPFAGNYRMGLANIVSFEPEASSPVHPMPKTDFYYFEPEIHFDEEYILKDSRTDEMYFDQRSLLTSQIEYTTDGSTHCKGGPCFTTTMRIINMLVDMDGDGDKDILSVRSPKDYSEVPLKWYWRENTDGFSFSPNYAEVIRPSNVLNPDALEYRIDSQKTESSSPVGFINVIVTHQGIYDMNGDGMADLVWQKRDGNYLELYVCLGSYNADQGKREFGNCSKWLTSPGAVSFLRRTEHRRSGTREYVWDTNDLFDINNDRLPDVIEVTAHNNYTETLMGAYLNTGSSFPSMHDYELKYGIGDEIPLSTGLSHYPACIRSSFSEAEKVTSITRDLIDLNGDGLLDMVENNPVGVTYAIKPYGVWWYCYPATDQSFRFAPGTDGGFDFNNTVTFDNLKNEPVWTTMDGVYEGLYDEVRSPTDGQFFDMNGDGIADYVQWSGGSSFYVRINTGKQLLDKMTWSWCSQTPCSPFSPFPPNPPQKNGPVDGITACIKFPITGNDGCNPTGGYALTQSIDDLNGDGQTEFIAIPWRNQNGTFRSTNTPWKIYRVCPNEAAPPSGMFLVSSENGASTEIAYTLADGYNYGNTSNKIPFPKWFVSQLRHTDYVENKVKQVMIRSYEGKYDHVTKEFRGFGKVEVDDYEKKVAHYFRQDEFNKGIEYRKETRESASPNTLRHLVEIAHETVSYNGGKRKCVRIIGNKATTYDGSAGQYTFQAKANYDYWDYTDYGLLRNIVYNYGDKEERRDVFEYYTIDDMVNGRYMVRLNKNIRKNENLDVVSEETLYYDEMNDCDGSSENLFKGKLCKKVVTRGSGLSDAATRYSYDSLGRLVEILSPDNVRSVVEYWGNSPYIFRTFYAVGSQAPYQVWHPVYFSDYHGLSGKAQKICGPQYIHGITEDKCDKVTFDKYGRPLSVAKALYWEDGRPYVEETVPAGQWKLHGYHNISTSAGKLKVNMSVYSGDVDLYLRKGAPPDASNYDSCSSNLGSTDEYCEVTGTGDIYIAAYVYLGDQYGKGTYGLHVTKRENDNTLAGSLGQGEWHHYGPFEHADYDKFRVDMSQNSGDSDLYVRIGAKPTQTKWDCRPYLTADEYCEFSSDTGLFYVSVRGKSASSSYALDVHWTQPIQGFKEQVVENISYYDKNSSSTPPYIVVNTWPTDSWLHEYTYGLQSLPVRTTYTYCNATGQLILEKQFLSGKYRKTYFDYDEYGRLKRAYRPIFSEVYGYDKSSETLDGAYETSYDVLGRITEIKNPQGFSNVQSFRGGTIELTDEIGRKTTYVKNKYNKIISKTQTANQVSLTSSYSYDGAGRIVWAQDPDGGQYFYSYNKDGKMRESQTPSQHWYYTYTPGGKISTTTKGSSTIATINHFYDAIGRLNLREEIPGKGATCTGPARSYSFFYDGSNPFIGRLTKVESQAYTEDHFKYNESGALLRKQLVDKSTGQTLWFEKIYSATGDIMKERFPEHEIQYRYNKLGQLTSLKAGSTGTYELDVSSVSYFANGKVDVISGNLANGGTNTLSFSRKFTYDAVDRITDIKTTINKANPWYLHYSHWGNGHIYYEIDTGLRNTSHYFLYDEANRVVVAQGYDFLSDGSPNSGGNFCFEYNRNSSLSSVKWNNEISQRTYVYGDLTKHRLDAITGGSDVKYSYDNDGQRCGKQIKGGLGTTYQWTPGGSLYFAEEGKSWSSYEYNEIGARWKANRNGKITYYLDDLEFIKGMSDHWRLNVELPGGIRCAMKATGTLDPFFDTCSFADIHDNIIATYDDQGNNVEVSEYMPYGVKRIISGNDDWSEFDFDGKIKENVGNLIHYGKRYYDPIARQWISPDPLRVAGVQDAMISISTLHPYTYAASDPISKMDPDGSEVNYVSGAKVGVDFVAGASPRKVIEGKAGEIVSKEIGGPVGQGVNAALHISTFKGAKKVAFGDAPAKGVGKLIIKGGQKIAGNIGKQVGSGIVRTAAGITGALSVFGTGTAIGSLLYGELGHGTLPRELRSRMRMDAKIGHILARAAMVAAFAQAVAFQHKVKEIECINDALNLGEADTWSEAAVICGSDIKEAHFAGGSGSGGSAQATSGQGDPNDYSQTTSYSSSSSGSASSGASESVDDPNQTSSGSSDSGSAKTDIRGIK